MTRTSRPHSVYVDPGRCIRCDACEEVYPGLLAEERPVPVDEQVLDAMAACPTGAIRWLEGEDD